MSSGFLSFDCTDDELVNGFKDRLGNVTPSSVLRELRACGIVGNDPRLKDVYKQLKTKDPDTVMSMYELFELGRHNLTILHQISCKELAIAHFQDYEDMIRQVYHMVEPERSGANADYIPILRDADPEKFGVAFCSIDGQFLELGDTREMFSVQSTSKAINFALALEQLDTTEVLEWVGIEPSGRPFNDTTFLPDSRPFNPMVNSGAIMTAGTLASAYPEVLKRDVPTGKEGVRGEALWKEVLLPIWTRLSGDGVFGDIGFSEETFLSERRTADNNIGIAHLLKSRRGLRGDIDTATMVDFYLRGCSTLNNAAGMSVMAATLANGGRNPFTGDQVLSVDSVKKTLSVLTLCGFYDNAGEFFFHTGVPCKSGVSGIIFLVLPNVGGFAIFSPRLNEYGNSVRGSEFSKKLVQLFSFHSFDNLSSGANGCKLDPRFHCDFSRHRKLSRMRWALRVGDTKVGKFDNFLVNVCLRVAQIDGSVDESELDELRQIYFEIMQSLLSRERITRQLEVIGEPTGEEAKVALTEHVKSHQQEFDDNQKELLLEAAFKVSTADGEVTETEEELLRALSDAMHVPPIVIDVKLHQWERVNVIEDEA